MSAEPIPSTIDPREARAKLTQLLGSGNMSIALQPIVNMVTGEPIGYEALSRPGEGSGFKSAGELFDAATICGMLWEIEALARERAIARAHDLPPGVNLFVNSTPQTFVDRRFVPAIEAQVRGAGIHPARIVLEITERTELDSSTALTANVRSLKSLGYQIAIDDAGAGASGLNRLMTLRPHWLKLDRELIEYIDQDRYKLNLIKFLVHFCKLSGVNLLAEGIERSEELSTMLDAGVPYCQGYILGKPLRDVQPALPGAVQLIRDRGRLIDSHLRDPREITVRMMMRPCKTMQASATIGEAASQMLTYSADGGFVVVDGRRCLGWCSLNQILHAAGTRQRAESLGLHVRPAGATLGPDSSLKQALELASVRDDDELAHPMIISDQTGVCGVLPLRLLMAAAAAGHVEARGSTDIMPVTGLPGRVAADIRLDEVLHSEEAADRSQEAVLIDVRSFTDFNRAFGYELGSRLINEVAQAIRSNITDQIPAASLFHLGEDRFLIIADGTQLRRRVEAFAGNFDQIISAFPVARNGSIARVNGDDMIPVSLGARVLYVGPLHGRLPHARAIYQIELQLRQKARTIEQQAGAGKSVIVVEERADESRPALRMTA